MVLFVDYTKGIMSFIDSDRDLVCPVGQLRPQPGPGIGPRRRAQRLVSASETLTEAGLRAVQTATSIPKAGDDDRCSRNVRTSASARCVFSQERLVLIDELVA
jgi:hypothetical protein